MDPQEDVAIDSAQGRPTTTAVRARVALLEHFTRFIAVVDMGPEPLPGQIERLDAMQVPGRTGPRPLWLPLDAAAQESQVQFLLPWVRRYLRGEIPPEAARQDRDCVARQWNPAVISRFHGKLTWEVNGDAFLFGLDQCEVYLFSTGIAVVVMECTIAKRRDASPTLADLVEFNYGLCHCEAHQAPRIRHTDAGRREGQPHRR